MMFLLKKYICQAVKRRYVQGYSPLQQMQNKEQH